MNMVSLSVQVMMRMIRRVSSVKIKKSVQPYCQLVVTVCVAMTSFSPTHRLESLLTISPLKETKMLMIIVILTVTVISTVTVPRRDPYQMQRFRS